MPVAHSPNGRFDTYLTHFRSALEEWVRTGVVTVENLIERFEPKHPDEQELAHAASASQDGSVAYNFNPADGTIAVVPAIPHTEETVRAAEDRGETPSDAAYEVAGVEPRSPGSGAASPATTSTATASSEELADTSTHPGATPDHPEGI